METDTFEAMHATMRATIQRRQLTTPLLLLLASHGPLTFAAGQLCHMLAPLGALLGWQGVNQWATLLSEPDANQRLATMLATPDPQPHPQPDQTQ